MLVGAIAACGGDGGTSPPKDVDLTGTWSVTLSPISGHGMDCQIANLQVTLTHTGNDLNGSYFADDMVCNGQHSGPLGGEVVQGTAVRGQLHFHFDTEDFDLHGTVASEDEASGTYTIVINVAGTLYTFTGTWSAHRT